MNEATERNRGKNNDNNGKYHEQIQIHGGVTWENYDFINKIALTTGLGISVVSTALNINNNYTWDEYQESNNDR